MTVVEFGSLFEFIRNGMSVRQDKSGDGLPITRIETISEAVVDSSRVGYARLEEKNCIGWLLQPGDILFSHINSVEHIGKCAVYEGTPEKLVHGMNLLCLRPDNSKLTPQFGKYLIRSNAFRSRLFNYVNKAVNQASVSIGNLKPIEVNVPPLPEQKRIAAILDKADSIRRKRQEAVRLTEELLRSVFLDMFGDPVENARKWPLIPLGSAIKTIETGWSANSEDRPRKNGEWAVLKISSVTSGRFLPGEYKVVADGQIDRELLIPKRGDLLFSRANTRELVAATCLVERDEPKLFLPDKLWKIIPDEEITCSEYLRYLLAHPRFREKLTKQATGTSGSMLITPATKHSNYAA